MKRTLFSILLALSPLLTFAEADEVSSLGFDIGYGYNYSWGTDPCITQSNGITLGIKANTCHFLWGCDVFCDIDGRYPMPNETGHHLVDISGAVRIGYEFYGFGFGAVVGGYQKAVEWVGVRENYVPAGYYPSRPYDPYHPYPYYPRYYKTYTNVYYYERKLLYGGFITYSFLRKRKCSPYLTLEMNNIQPVQVTIGIEFNFAN